MATRAAILDRILTKNNRLRARQDSSIISKFQLNQTRKATCGECIIKYMIGHPSKHWPGPTLLNFGWELPLLLIRLVIIIQREKMQISNFLNPNNTKTVNLRENCYSSIDSQWLGLSLCKISKASVPPFFVRP